MEYQAKRYWNIIAFTRGEYVFPWSMLSLLQKSLFHRAISRALSYYFIFLISLLRNTHLYPIGFYNLRCSNYMSKYLTFFFSSGLIFPRSCHFGHHFCIDILCKYMFKSLTFFHNIDSLHYMQKYCRQLLLFGSISSPYYHNLLRSLHFSILRYLVLF